MKIYNTEMINSITNKYINGKKIKRSEQIFFNNTLDVRKANINFSLTSDELFELYSCSADIFYFIEKYLNIKLYDYQIEMINNYFNNRFNIYMNSLQVGFNTIISAIFLWESIFIKDTAILIFFNKSMMSIELINKIKEQYIKLPFFMKPGVRRWTIKNIIFENLNRISVRTSGRDYSIGHTTTRLFLGEFAFVKDDVIRNFYKNITPSIICVNDSKIIISSQPNGCGLFQELVNNSILPDNHPNKNLYNIQRIYWWEVPNRGEDWKKNIIKIIGEDKFRQHYDLSFKSSF